MTQLSMSQFATKADFDAAVAANKKVVHYIDPLYIEVGQRATVTPVDHTNPVEGQGAINGQIAHTSTVLNYDKETGVFETRYSIYKPFVQNA